MQLEAERDKIWGSRGGASAVFGLAEPLSELLVSTTMRDKRLLFHDSAAMYQSSLRKLTGQWNKA